MENQIKPNPLQEAINLLGNYAQVRRMLEEAGGARTRKLLEAVETLEVEICNRINAIKGT